MSRACTRLSGPKPRGASTPTPPTGPTGPTGALPVPPDPAADMAVPLRGAPNKGRVFGRFPGSDFARSYWGCWVLRWMNMLSKICLKSKHLLKPWAQIGGKQLAIDDAYDHWRLEPGRFHLLLGVVLSQDYMQLCSWWAYCTLWKTAPSEVNLLLTLRLPMMPHDATCCQMLPSSHAAFLALTHEAKAATDFCRCVRCIMVAASPLLHHSTSYLLLSKRHPPTTRLSSKASPKSKHLENVQTFSSNINIIYIYIYIYIHIYIHIHIYIYIYHIKSLWISQPLEITWKIGHKFTLNWSKPCPHYGAQPRAQSSFRIRLP